MAKTLAVAGKGGTGKTTFTALMIRYLIERKKGSILAVDADPNSNLNEALGLEVKSCIADILDDTKNPKAIPEGMTKDMFIEYKISQAVVETENVDLLVMGGPQGAGCYCYPNDLLRKHLEILGKNYEYLVVDNEAGLEHISRRIIQNVEHLFVISDASARGIRSAARIRELVASMKAGVGDISLIVTKTGEAGLGALQAEVDKTGLKLAGVIPFDPLVTDFDVEGRPLFQLPDDSPAVKAIMDILDRASL